MRPTTASQARLSPTRTREVAGTRVLDDRRLDLFVLVGEAQV